MIAVAGESRPGTDSSNGDAWWPHETDGEATVAVIDGVGDDLDLHVLVDAMSLVAARVGHQRGGLAGLLTAADLLCGEHEAAGLVAQVDAHGFVHIHWVGDCRAWWWDGAELRQLTTDHTMGQLLRVSGGRAVEQVAASQDHWLRLGMSGATPVTVAEVVGLGVDHRQLRPGQRLLLTTDGVHDTVNRNAMVELLRLHDDPQDLATLLTDAVVADASGRRDDATAVVIGVDQ